MWRWAKVARGGSSSNAAKKRLLEKYDEAYYNRGQPLVSDAEYDALRASLRNVETVRVAANDSAKNVAHSFPLCRWATPHPRARFAFFLLVLFGFF